jgi:Fe2+ or Zn2+ uptake regulation protein
MPSRTPKELLRAKFRQYEKLLDDPVFVALLPELLTSLQSVPSKSLTSKKQTKLALTAPKRKAGRKPGPLAEKAFDIVIGSMRELSAKQVFAILESDGISIKGRDRAVTVSKVLRQLAKAGRISSRRSGPGKKAAILYQSNAIAQSFPVQEKEVTQ